MNHRILLTALTTVTLTACQPSTTATANATQVAHLIGAANFHAGADAAAPVTSYGAATYFGQVVGIDTFISTGARDGWIQAHQIQPVHEGETWVVYYAQNADEEGKGEDESPGEEGGENTGVVCKTDCGCGHTAPGCCGCSCVVDENYRCPCCGTEMP
jgi:hypothetical protein